MIVRDVRERNWYMNELKDTRKKLKIGTLVSVKVNFGESEDGRKRKGRLMHGEVVGKYRNHFVVNVKAKNGTWNESYKYTGLFPDGNGNVMVKVLKKGKK